MRFNASEVEGALRAALAELGLSADPITTVHASGWQTGDEPQLSEDRDAPPEAGLEVFAARPGTPPLRGSVFMVSPGPDGLVDVVDVDQDLRAIKLDSVADLAWTLLATRHGLSAQRMLAFEE